MLWILPKMVWEMDPASIAMLAAVLTTLAASIAGLTWAGLRIRRAREKARLAERHRTVGQDHWTDENRPLSRLDRHRANHMGRIAVDIALQGSAHESCRRHHEATTRLTRRLELVGLDPRMLALEYVPEFHHMQTFCSLCDRRGRCAHDLAYAPKSSSWERYCLNVQAIRALVEN
jgi:hypothetical protein